MILRLLRAGIRRVFNLSFLAALSLLLGIGLGCLWVRSMRVADWLTYRGSSGLQVSLTTNPRQFHVILLIPWGVPEIPWGVPENGFHYESDQWNPEEVSSFLAAMWELSWLGFKLIRYDSPYQGGGEHVTDVFIPLWFPMVLALIAPLCWLRRWRRQAQRKRMGLCLHCGYDHRATPSPTGPSLPRCPECGHESRRRS